MKTISQTPAVVTDGPVLTHITAENLPNTGRYKTTVAAYVELAGAAVFTLPAADMPEKATGFLWSEPDIPTAIVIVDGLTPAGFEDAVFALIIRWVDGDRARYATKWPGVGAVAIRKIEDGEAR